MSKKITKAMVLCAGLGTRLHPITHTIPKPLVPVLNIPNVFYTFFMLKAAGISDVIVNLFHLSDEMESFLREHNPFNLNISYSKETVLLGTGGGLKKASAFFNGEAFILANCDFITNISLAPLIEQHEQRNALATMVLYQDPSRQHLYSKVGVDASGNLCALPKLQTKTPSVEGIFTGIHILENSVLTHLEEKPSGINEILYPYLMKNQPTRVYGEIANQVFWHDTGDVNAILHASKELLSELKNGNPFLRALFDSVQSSTIEKLPGLWMEEDEVLPKNIQIEGPVLIAKGCTLHEGSQIGPNVIIGSGSRIGSKSHLSNAVLFEKSITENGSKISACLYYLNSALPAKPLA